MSSEKVRATNLNCSVIADVRHDGSEPCVDVLFGKQGHWWARTERDPSSTYSGSLTHRFASSPGDGYRLIMRGAHLTTQEMLSALASHIRARNAAAAASAPSADKVAPGTGTRR